MEMPNNSNHADAPDPKGDNAGNVISPFGELGRILLARALFWARNALGKIGSAFGWRDKGVKSENTFPQADTFNPGPDVSSSFSVFGQDGVYIPQYHTQEPLERKARIVAFYLPQFHPIPENDLWWGAGFTEWTNVKAAVPRFNDHYQPHVPDALGYYDLRDGNILRRQISFASAYGLYGMCFYFYWFAGKRLLELPILRFLDDRTLNFPFMLCWANENWSRRWDGSENELLIQQNHSEDDDLAFISYISKYLVDERYIRVQGRPILVVYRPSLLPRPAETAHRWREWCIQNGVGEIYLACTQSFERTDPREYGFDAAIEFPPNNSGLPDISSTIKSPDFSGSAFDYTTLAGKYGTYSPSSHKVFRAVCPGWDNSARRGAKGTVFLGSSPRLYETWLRKAILDTAHRYEREDERLVFVNAWNEWAEGAHLEPDQRNGFAYLDATRAAASGQTLSRKERVLVVSHDAHPHGAQMLALNIVNTLLRFGMEVDALLLGAGSLTDDFRKATTMFQANSESPDMNSVKEHLAHLRAIGVKAAIVNSTASGTILPYLRQQGISCLTLVHELPGLILNYRLEEVVQIIANHSAEIIFPSATVKAGFERLLGSPLAHWAIRPQGLYRRSCFGLRSADMGVRIAVRAELGWPSGVKIILGAGYGDQRKGLDLFVDAAIDALIVDDLAVAIWVGNCVPEILEAQTLKIANHGLEERFKFAGFYADPSRFFRAADVFGLSSREDPFPSVVLEALAAGLPVVTFQDGGGATDLIDRGCGVTVPMGDTIAMARALGELLSDPASSARIGEAGTALIRAEFNFHLYVRDLLSRLMLRVPRVSVIVPNYNYARYLGERFRSIEHQTIAVFEIIILDDASTDGSDEQIDRFALSTEIPTKIIRNVANSGSPVGQWRQGMDHARGDFIWIAESDDVADPNFLEAVLSAFQRDDVVMSYCQSRQIDEHGNVLCSDYLEYLSDIDNTRWTKSYIVDGRSEIETALYVKNTIPNVSAVVFRRQAISDVFSRFFDELAKFQSTADWMTYLRLLETGAIAFTSRTCNSHRRHEESVTHTSAGRLQLREILAIQAAIADRFHLDCTKRKKAEAYAEQLYVQFGLSSLEKPSFHDDPDLMHEVANLERLTAPSLCR